MSSFFEFLCEKKDVYLLTDENVSSKSFFFSNFTKKKKITKE